MNLVNLSRLVSMSSLTLLGVTAVLFKYTEPSIHRVKSLNTMESSGQKINNSVISFLEEMF